MADKVWVFDLDGTLMDTIDLYRKPSEKAYALLMEILGEKFVEGIIYKDKITGKETTLKVSGIFVEIGQIPNTDFVKGLVELNKFGEIIVDHRNQRASLEGVWAAGDASDVLFKQNNISAGDAVKAVLSIDTYLHGRWATIPLPANPQHEW